MEGVLEGEIDLRDAAAAMVEMDNATVGEYIRDDLVQLQQVNEDATKPEDQEVENGQEKPEIQKIVKKDAGDLAMLMEQVGGQDDVEMEVEEKKTIKNDEEQGNDEGEERSEDMEDNEVAEDDGDEEWQGSGESEEEAVKIVHSYTRKPRNVGISRQGRSSKTSQAPTRASVVASDQLRASSKINQEFSRRGKSGHNTRTHMQDMKEEDSYSSEDDRNNKGLFTCGACGKQYDSKKELYVHSLTHTVRQKFLCQICDKSFNNENMYKRHQAMHMKEERKKTVCQICNIVFNKRAELEQHHFDVHVGEKAFQCDSCGLEFSWRENYQKHMRIHRQRPYMCALCKQDFSDVKSLSVHIATHETDKGKDAQAVEDDIKPHTCDLCGLKFKFSFTLEAHMKNHIKDEKATSVIEYKQAATPVPPAAEPVQQKSNVVDFDAKNFVCHICDSAFKWKFSLDAHLIIHEQGDKRKMKASRGRVRTRGGLTHASLEENGNGDDSHDYIPSSSGRGRGPRTRGRGSRGKRGRPPIVTQPKVDADFPEPELFEDMPEPSKGPKKGRKSRMIIEAHASGMVQEELEGEIGKGGDISEEDVDEEDKPQPKRVKREKRRSSKGDRRYPEESDEAVSPTSSPRTRGSPARRGIFDIMQNEITPEKEGKPCKSNQSKDKDSKKESPEEKNKEKRQKRGRKPKKSQEQSAEEEDEKEEENISPKPLTIFTCDVCHKDFKAYDSLKVHKLCHKVEKHIAYGSSPMQSPERNEEKDLDDASVVRKEELAWVIKAKAAKNARKTFCEKQGKFFLHAIEAVVKRRKAFQCDICKRRFKLYVELLTDQHKHRSVKAFKCPKKKCKERYPRKAALVIHAMRHGLEMYMS